MAFTFQEGVFAPQDYAIWRGSLCTEAFASKKRDEVEFAKFRHSTTMQWSSRERMLARQKRILKRAREMEQQEREEEEAQAMEELPSEREDRAQAMSRACSETRSSSAGTTPSQMQSIPSPLAAAMASPMGPRGSQASVGNATFGRFVLQAFADGGAPRASPRATVCGKVGGGGGLAEPGKPGGASNRNSLPAYVACSLPPQPEGDRQTDTPPREPLKLKSDRLARLNLKGLKKSKRREQRLVQLLEVRRLEFEAKPSQEKQTLKAAFLAADTEESGSLDHAELVRACNALGLVPRCEAERKEFDAICLEVAILGEVDFMMFVFEAVPRIREKLRELRRFGLRQHFALCDADGSGYLSETEARDIVQKYCSGSLDDASKHKLLGAFQEAYLTARDPETGEVDFDGFEELVGTVQEHYQRVARERKEDIQRREHLTEEEVAEHSEELIWMYDVFHRASVPEVGALDTHGIKRFLIEYSIMPHNCDVETCLEFAGLSPGGYLGFRELLQLLTFLREVQRKEAFGQRRLLFQQVDRDKSGQLSLVEVFGLIADLGLAPRCRDEQIEIHQLISSIDEDGSGSLNDIEFEGLVQELEDRLGSEERKRVWRLAAELGFADREVLTLREAFWTLDVAGCGTLDIELLRELVDRLRMSLSAEQLSRILSSVDPYGSSGRSPGELDLSGFLRFAHKAGLDLQRLDCVLARGWGEVHSTR